MDKKETYQLAYEGAQFYEKHFVPSIFGPWAKIMVEKLELEESDNLLDVACGTGIVARTAQSQSSIEISALDINHGMLEVAKQQNQQINWIHGSAENLPFDDNHFNKVACQFGFMFFPDHHKTIAEMQRVTKPNGKIVISVWDTIQNNEGYAELVEIVEDIAGNESANILRSPFQLGNVDELVTILNAYGLNHYTIVSTKAEVTFPSIENWIDCDVKASPIIQSISTDQYESLKQIAQTKLQSYVQADGKVRFNMSAHFVSL